LFNAKAILGSSRLAWIDYAKGLTIILVVYHHSFLTLINAGVKVAPWLINANLAVYAFRMPMFFILSGLFITRSVAKRGGKKYIENRASLLLYPYFLWGIMQASFGIFFSEYTAANWRAQRYLLLFYQPSTTSQLWYLITLFNTGLLFVIVGVKLKFGLWQQFAFGILLYILSPLLFFNSMIQDTTRYYVYLVFGSLISKFILKRENFGLISSSKLTLPLGLLAFLSQYYLFEHQYFYLLERHLQFVNLTFWSALRHLAGIFIFTVIVVLGCAFVLNVCAILQRRKCIRFLRVVGYHSLYIYLMHVLVVVGIRIFSINFLGYTNPFVILPIQIIVGVLGPVIVYNLFKRWGLTLLFEYEPGDVRKMFRNVNVLLKYKKT